MKQNLENNIHAQQVSQALGKKALTKGNQSQGSGDRYTLHNSHVRSGKSMDLSVKCSCFSHWLPKTFLCVQNDHLDSKSWCLTLTQTHQLREGDAVRMRNKDPWWTQVYVTGSVPFLLPWGFPGPQNFFVCLFVCWFYQYHSYYIFSLLFFSSSPSRWAPPAAISTL